MCDMAIETDTLELYNPTLYSYENTLQLAPKLEKVTGIKVYVFTSGAMFIYNPKYSKHFNQVFFDKVIREYTIYFADAYNVEKMSIASPLMGQALGYAQFRKTSQTINLQSYGMFFQVEYFNNEGKQIFINGVLGEQDFCLIPSLFNYIDEKLQSAQKE